ncbi:cytochrome b5 domain-containing protein [Candidatus Woesearchaeota archaeon]|nr:cytochrome b5 domain-containing protein [Candidatus Woesearchaeota archaeon]
MKYIWILLAFFLLLSGCSSSANTNAILEVQTYTLEEVSLHNSSESCYTAIDGKVYDLTTWIAIHPGGDAAILSLCGIDGSEKFNEKHGNSGSAKYELSLFYIGELAP